MAENRYSLYILEDNESFSMIIQKYLADSLRLRFPGREFNVRAYSEASKAFHDQVKAEQPEILILDYYLGEKEGQAITGIQVLQSVREYSPGTEVIMLTGDDSLDKANSMMRSGAFDYIVKSPAAPIKVLKSVLSLLAIQDARAASARNRKLLYLLAGAWMGLVGVAVLLKALGIL